MEFYIGESLNFIFSTPIPGDGTNRVSLTGYDKVVKLAGKDAVLETLNDYSFRAFFPKETTANLTGGVTPLTIVLSAGTLLKMGKTVELYALSLNGPRVARGNDQNFTINFATENIQLSIDVAHISESNYDIWLKNGHAGGTEQEFLEWLRKPATDAAAAANEAATLATTKANLADEKAGLADQKATEANQAAETANNAAIAANQAAGYAGEAGDYANASAALAVQKAGSANDAATAANTAANLANQKAVLADEKALLAGQKATEANTAAGSANDAATAANATNEDIQEAEGLRVAAETARNAAEQNRTTAETARVNAEGDATKGRVKAENDRAAAEILRQQQEAVRVQAENDRITAGAIIQSQIVNNLSETAAGKVLDARQGPILLNMLTKMNENWIGVVIDPSLSCSEPAPKSTVVAYRATELQRTGNLEFHKFGKSRIFNAFYPAIVIRATKEIAWKLDKSDFSKKEDGTVSTPDWTIHNICIVIPDLYRRIVLLDNTQDGRYEIRYDIAPFDGATLFHEESYHSISDAQMDRTLTQLVSVVSDDVRFRGGNNDATRDSEAWRTQLGMPATQISRMNFETYANNAGWETFNIYDHTLFSELAMLYFANTNIQLDYTSVLTAEGYPQGGLGAGNTTWIGNRWSEKNGYNPLDKVGEGSMSIGCKVGVKSKTVTNYYIGSVTGVTAGKCVSTANFSAGNGWLTSYVGYTIRNLTTNATAMITAKDNDNTLSLSDNIFTAVGQIFHIEGATFNYGVPVFFGLENIYGHLWKHCSGINIMIQSADAGGRSMAYVNPDWATRSGTEITSNYQYVGDIPRSDGYLKALYPGWDIPKIIGAGSNTYMSDYFYMSIPASGSSLRCLLVSADANGGAFAGLRDASSNFAPSDAYSGIGARLRAKKPKNG